MTQTHFLLLAIIGSSLLLTVRTFAPCAIHGYRQRFLSAHKINLMNKPIFAIRPSRSFDDPHTASPDINFDYGESPSDLLESGEISSSEIIGTMTRSFNNETRLSPSISITKMTGALPSEKLGVSIFTALLSLALSNNIWLITLVSTSAACFVDKQNSLSQGLRGIGYHTFVFLARLYMILFKDKKVAFLLRNLDSQIAQLGLEDPPSLESWLDTSKRTSSLDERENTVAMLERFIEAEKAEIVIQRQEAATRREQQYQQWKMRAEHVRNLARGISSAIGLDVEPASTAAAPSAASSTSAAPADEQEDPSDPCGNLTAVRAPETNVGSVADFTQLLLLAPTREREPAIPSRGIGTKSGATDFDDHTGAVPATYAMEALGKQKSAALSDPTQIPGGSTSAANSVQDTESGPAPPTSAVEALLSFQLPEKSTSSLSMPSELTSVLSTFNDPSVSFGLEKRVPSIATLAMDVTSVSSSPSGSVSSPSSPSSLHSGTQLNAQQKLAIKERYRALTKQFHPDSQQAAALPPELSNALMANLNQAYDSLVQLKPKVSAVDARAKRSARSVFDQAVPPPVGTRPPEHAQRPSPRMAVSPSTSSSPDPYSPDLQPLSFEALSHDPSLKLDDRNKEDPTEAPQTSTEAAPHALEALDCASMLDVPSSGPAEPEFPQASMEAEPVSRWDPNQLVAGSRLLDFWSKSQLQQAQQAEEVQQQAQLDPSLSPDSENISAPASDSKDMVGEVAHTEASQQPQSEPQQQHKESQELHIYHTPRYSFDHSVTPEYRRATENQGHSLVTFRHEHLQAHQTPLLRSMVPSRSSSSSRSNDRGKRAHSTASKAETTDKGIDINQGHEVNSKIGEEEGDDDDGDESYRAIQRELQRKKEALVIEEKRRRERERHLHSDSQQHQHQQWQQRWLKEHATGIIDNNRSDYAQRPSASMGRQWHDDDWTLQRRAARVRRVAYLESEADRRRSRERARLDWARIRSGGCDLHGMLQQARVDDVLPRLQMHVSASASAASVAAGSSGASKQRPQLQMHKQQVQKLLQQVQQQRRVVDRMPLSSTRQGILGPAGLSRAAVDAAHAEEDEPAAVLTLNADGVSRISKANSGSRSSSLTSQPSRLQDLPSAYKPPQHSVGSSIKSASERGRPLDTLFVVQSKGAAVGQLRRDGVGYSLSHDGDISYTGLLDRTSSGSSTSRSSGTSSTACSRTSRSSGWVGSSPRQWAPPVKPGMKLVRQGDRYVYMKSQQE